MVTHSESEHPPAADDPVVGIDEAVADLHGLTRLPSGAHVAVFERVHAALTDALSAIDGV